VEVPFGTFLGLAALLYLLVEPWLELSRGLVLGFGV
jgi:hypothetical protein